MLDTQMPVNSQREYTELHRELEDTRELIEKLKSKERYLLEALSTLDE